MNELTFKILATEGASETTLARYMLGQPVMPSVRVRIEKTAERLGIVLPRLQPTGSPASGGA